MTQEQIAEMVRGLYEEEGINTELLARLIEERRRLLEALQRSRQCCTMPGCREATDGALIFAEQPA